MRITKLAVGLLAGAILLSGAAQAAVLDDFNRPNQNNLGSDWTNVGGAPGRCDIQGGQASCGLRAMYVYSGPASYTGDVVEFDFSVGSGTYYASAVLNYDATNNYFIKVQKNAIQATGFDIVRFGHGNNINDSAIISLGEIITSGHLYASMNGSVATLIITPTGGTAKTFTYDYGFDLAGTGIGIGGSDGVKIDNFAAPAAVPEPATWAMMIGGFGMVGAAMRRRSRLAATA